jgi:hypothetical protein
VNELFSGTKVISICFYDMQVKDSCFFHIRACHHNKKSFIPTITMDDVEILHEEDKVETINIYFEEILGKSASDSINLDFSRLFVPTFDMSSLDCCFSEEEFL